MNTKKKMTEQEFAARAITVLNAYGWEFPRLNRTNGTSHALCPRYVTLSRVTT